MSSRQSALLGWRSPTLALGRLLPPLPSAAQRAGSARPASRARRPEMFDTVVLARTDQSRRTGRSPARLRSPSSTRAACASCTSSSCPWDEVAVARLSTRRTSRRKWRARYGSDGRRGQGRARDSHGARRWPCARDRRGRSEGERGSHRHRHAWTYGRRRHAARERPAALAASRALPGSRRSAAGLRPRGRRAGG